MYYRNLNQITFWTLTKIYNFVDILKFVLDILFGALDIEMPRFLTDIRDKTSRSRFLLFVSYLHHDVMNW